jgi:hypothetical protein
MFIINSFNLFIDNFIILISSSHNNFKTNIKSFNSNVNNFINFIQLNFNQKTIMINIGFFNNINQFFKINYYLYSIHFINKSFNL